MPSRKDELIAEMQRNSNAWDTASEAERRELNRRNSEIVQAIDAITGGKSSYDSDTGTWRLSDGTRSMRINGRVEYISPESWSDISSYDSELRSTLERLKSYPEFSYDAANDPLYSQYRKQYVREGDRSARDTAGLISAQTGGIASSYAASAAQQAQNYYNSQLADKIPELAELAYDMYADEYQREYQRLRALMEADSDEYARWKSDRDYRYDAARDEIADARYADELAYERERDRIKDSRYDEERAYERERDRIKDAKDAARAARAYANKSKDNDKDKQDGESDASKNEPAKEKAPLKGTDIPESLRDRFKNGAGHRAQELYERMMSAPDPAAWLDRNARNLSQEEFALLWVRLYN